MVIERRLDGTMAIRLRGKYLKDQEAAGPGGSAPRPPEFNALAADASGEEEGRDPVEGPAASGVPPPAGRSGRTPAEPYPPDGATKDSDQEPWRPAKDHPWRKPFKRQK